MSVKHRTTVTALQSPQPAAEEFPAVRSLIPHAGEMVLLDEITAAGEAFCECIVRIGAESLHHNEYGEVPAAVGLEMMAQCAAVYGGLSSTGGAPPVGFLLGTRRLECRCESFYPGQELRVRAERSGGLGAMCTFACSIRDASDGAELLGATLNVYIAGEAPNQKAGA